MPSHKNTPFLTFEEAVQRTHDARAQDAESNGANASGVMDFGGLALFTECLALRPGLKLTVLGDSGVGKTLFAQNMLHYLLADQPGTPVVFFTLEMPVYLLLERQQRIAGAAQLDDLLDAYQSVYFVEFLAHAEELYQALDAVPEKPALVLFDHLKMVIFRVGHRIDELALWAGHLTNLAKKYETRVVELHQPRRAKDRHGVDLVTQYSPLPLNTAYGGGAIRELADYMIGLYRPDLRPGITPYELQEERGTFVTHLMKNRITGVMGEWLWRFDEDTLRITEEVGGII